MKNRYLYNYQIENLQELDGIPEKLENKTKEQYLIKIGSYEFKYFNNNWITEKGIIYLAINHETNFITRDDLVENVENWNLYQIKSENIKIKFDKDIYLKINKTINKILKDNAAREAYHNKLNNQLQAINNSL